MESTLVLDSSVAEVLDSTVVASDQLEGVETLSVSAAPQASPETPQNVSTDASDDDALFVSADSMDLAKLGFDEKSAEKFVSREARIIVGLGRLYGGSTSEHVKLGKEMFEALNEIRNALAVQHESKGAGPLFTKDDAYAFVNRWAVIASRRNAIGDKRVDKKGNEKAFNAMADVKGYLWAKKVSELVAGGKDTVMALPWGCIRDHFLKTATFDAGKLTLGIRGESAKSSQGWPEFIKRWVSLYASFGDAGTEFEGWTDYRGTLSQAIADKEAEIAEAKDADLTQEQRDKKEQAAKKAEKDKHRAAARKGLEKYMAEALIHLSASDVAAIVASAAQELNVDLPFNTLSAQSMDLAQAIPAFAVGMTAENAQTLIKDIYARDRRDVLEAIADLSGKLAAAAGITLKVA